MKKLLTVLLICTVTVAFCFATGTTEAAATTKEVTYKDTAVIGFQSKTTTVDPTGQTTVAHRIFFGLTHNGLVNYDEATGKILPELATAWETKDNKTWTFTLRDDVYFHNGEKFTADDVVFTYEYGKNAANATIKNFYKGATAKAIDDTHVQIILDKANIDLLYQLCLEYMGIVNREAVTADAQNGAAIGTGPYKNVEFVVSDHTYLDAFDKYWGGDVPTAHLKFRFISDASTRLAALEAGEIDVCQGTNNTEIPLVEENEELDVAKFAGTALTYLAFNLNDPMLQDENLRLAIAFAINSQEVVDGAASGYGTVANGMWGFFQYGYFDRWESVGQKSYTQNAEIAKQYLAKSKYPNGGITLEFCCNSAWTVGSLSIIKAQLKQILNIEVAIKQYDAAGFTAATTKNNFQVAIHSLTFTAAGTDAARVFTPGNSANIASYDNSKVNELFALAASETNEAKRLAYYQQIQEIVHSECPYIGLYYASSNASYNKKVSGCVWNPSGRYDYTNIRVAE